MGSFSIKVADARNKFSASHFLVLGEGHKCSRLHGHNYTVGLSISGPLDDNFFVVDFIEVKEKLQAIVEKLDHIVLIPTESEHVKVSVEGGEVLVETPFKRYIFPESDVCLLPIAATTSELLAKYIFDQLKTNMPNYKLRVTVGETSVTKAIYEEGEE